MSSDQFFGQIQLFRLFPFWISSAILPSSAPPFPLAPLTSPQANPTLHAQYPVLPSIEGLPMGTVKGRAGKPVLWETGERNRLEGRRGALDCLSHLFDDEAASVCVCVYGCVRVCVCACTWNTDTELKKSSVFETGNACNRSECGRNFPAHYRVYIII